MPHCLRRVDTDLTVADRIGEVHFDGQIWSRALWDIRNALGPALADKIIIDAQFDFAPDTSFQDAALATVAAAQRFDGSTGAERRDGGVQGARHPLTRTGRKRRRGRRTVRLASPA